MVFSLLGFNLVYYLAWQTNALIFTNSLFFILHLAYSVYKRALCCSLSFIVAKCSDCVSYIIFIIFACHNFLKMIMSAMGLWINSGERGIVCAQAEPKWVIIGSIRIPLLRTFRPNTTGGSPAQHCKKFPPHYKVHICSWYSFKNIKIWSFYDSILTIGVHICCT